ncbi:MAG: CRISPR-associated helicase Cas3' [Clostridia bacterium]|nr:CRISPR-associated helicase Cas3' [Clostridia bacterium]
MRGIIPFDQCWARPRNEQGEFRLLSDHLLYVARGCGEPEGDALSRIRFLGGLMHDAGKARASWQRYIRRQSRESSNHSPLGSALFFYVAMKTIDQRGIWRDSGIDADADTRRLVLQISRDIYDHHGELRDINEEPPWINIDVYRHAAECDLDGFADFVGTCLSGVLFDVDRFPDWVREEAEDAWRRWHASSQIQCRAALSNSRQRYVDSASKCVRMNTAAMVAADRLDAAGVSADFEYPIITAKKADKALRLLSDYCTSRAEALAFGGSSQSIVDTRGALQDQCVQRFHHALADKPDARVFTLVLPTGMGKTVTSTRVALEACKDGLCERIVYVAPYMSILSQASREIRRATGIRAMEHHHLSVIGPDGKERAYEEGVSEDEGAVMLDSWAASVVATTFNQYFRALFPSRAQQTMRIKALRRAFIVIDEPQVIDHASWTVFLAMLEATARSCDARVLLSTATLPPLQLGLSEPAVALAPDAIDLPSHNRYKIEVSEIAVDEAGAASMAAEALRKLMEENNFPAVAVVMNTVGDAYRVYSEACKLVGSRSCRLLTACMTGPHKASKIRRLQRDLSRRKPLLAVCTQIIECGVDLSFPRIIRALPIIPSIVQAAGRVNRHGEMAGGVVTVFPFARSSDGKDTREFIYRPRALLQATDACTKSHSSWDEPESREIVGDYYAELMARTTATGPLDRLVDAALGEWSALGRPDPFGQDYPQASVFVPFGVSLLGSRVRALLDFFAPSGLMQLYERYLDPHYRNSLSFRQRKQFMAVLQHFIVPLDAKATVGRVAFDREHPIGILSDVNSYSRATGLAQFKAAPGEEDPSGRFMI